MVVKPKTELPVDEFELHCLSDLTSPDCKLNVSSQFEVLITRVLLEVTRADATSPSTFRGHMTPWWRVIGTCAETALTVTRFEEAPAFCSYITTCMAHLNESLNAVVANSDWNPMAKETLSVYSGFNLTYTSIVRSILESVFALADPLLACEALLGLESVVPMDNKGICNVYKKARSVETSFEDCDSDVSFEKFWTVMSVSRRLHAELLSETKAWGKFSQSCSSSLSILMEQSGENLEATGACEKEPLIYDSKPSSFPIQLTSSSFRRRAVFNILFTAAYVVQNATNALISAGAKTLFQTVLKSLPTELNEMMEFLLKFENHWLAWKSHSKEVCGPFEATSRIERNLVPFGDGALTATHCPAASTEPLIVPMSISEHIEETCDVSKRLEEYRQYVSDAILCDISDDAERERLAANDEGLEEAMRKNNDRVLLWQFKRMRFDQSSIIENPSMIVEE